MLGTLLRGSDVQTLNVIGVEDGVLLAATESGERFRIPVDESVRLALADAGSPAFAAKKLSPRDIQAHVRSGLSVEQVAALMGAPIAAVERFVRPVLAERAFVLDSAMRVPVLPQGDDDAPRTFGAAMAERLEALHAGGVEWSSLKAPGGPWVVVVAFSADDVDHRARWSFDVKRRTLTAENLEATTLSQQGTPATLAPRLHAVEPTGPVAVPIAVPDEPDRSRFDSAVFELPDLAQGARPSAPKPTADLLEARARRRIERDAVDSGALAITRALETVPDRAPIARPAAVAAPAESRPEELRRSRERALQPDAQRTTRPAPRVEAPRPEQARHVSQEPSETRPVAVPAGPTRPRRGRTSLPSWDEIVFGRTEE